MKVRACRSRSAARLGHRLAVYRVSAEMHSVRKWHLLAWFAEDEHEAARLSSGLDMLRQRARRLLGVVL